MNSVSKDAPSGGDALYDAYFPFAGKRDEAKNAAGSYRKAWVEMFESLGRHGDEGLQKWRGDVARISRQRGLAYHPAAVEGTDPRGNWELDPVPWMIEPNEWQKIEAGIGQRTRLFEAILADIYGPQRLIKENLMPAEIILGHRGYLPDLFDLKPGGAVIGLGISAVDLVYVNSGHMFALNDRFDSPFGLGVALENRTIVNAVLPNLFRRCQVRRIGYFFRDWFQNLADRAPGTGEYPRTVIVDTTPKDEDSEISFLANYC